MCGHWHGRANCVWSGTPPRIRAGFSVAPRPSVAHDTRSSDHISRTASNPVHLARPDYRRKDRINRPVEAEHWTNNQRRGLPEWFLLSAFFFLLKIKFVTLIILTTQCDRLNPRLS